MAWDSMKHGRAWSGPRHWQPKHSAIIRDLCSGLDQREVARKHGISHQAVQRLAASKKGRLVIRNIERALALALVKDMTARLRGEDSAKPTRKE